MHAFTVIRPHHPHPTVLSDTQHARSIAADVNATASLAPLIDHTLLKLDADEHAHAHLCDEAMQYGFASVCIRPAWVQYCVTRLSASHCKTITVISFPHGATSTTERIAEAQQALHDGAQELDMVIALEGLRDLNYGRVLEDIAAVVSLAGIIPVKIILETGLLSTTQKIVACTLAKAAGAAYVKTSTGFAGDQGATTDDVHLMRTVVGMDMGVKASGGIRSAQTARAMIAAGATRLGTSASVQIVTATDPMRGASAAY